MSNITHDPFKAMEADCKEGWDTIKSIFNNRSDSEVDMLKTLYHLAFSRGWNSSSDHFTREMIDIYENGIPEEDD